MSWITLYKINIIWFDVFHLMKCKIFQIVFIYGRLKYEFYFIFCNENTHTCPL
jgi:hypothetical protein